MTTAVPPSTCLIHGPIVGSVCPVCSTLKRPDLNSRAGLVDALSLAEARIAELERERDEIEKQRDYDYKRFTEAKQGIIEADSRRIKAEDESKGHLKYIKAKAEQLAQVEAQVKVLREALELVNCGWGCGSTGVEANPPGIAELERERDEIERRWN